MKKSTAPASLPEPTEEEIHKIAHRLWIEGGCLDGVELENWFAANELLRPHHGRNTGRPMKAASLSATAADPR